MLIHKGSSYIVHAVMSEVLLQAIQINQSRFNMSFKFFKCYDMGFGFICKYSWFFTTFNRLCLVQILSFTRVVIFNLLLFKVYTSNSNKHQIVTQCISCISNTTFSLFSHTGSKILHFSFSLWPCGQTKDTFWGKYTCVACTQFL